MKRFTALCVVFTAFLITGCSVTEPYQAAETPAQKAYAISATYNVVLESARDIVVDETAPLRLRQAVQRVEARTTPVIAALDTAVVDFITEQAKFNQAQSTEAKLAVAADNLALWIIKAEAALVDLVTAVKGD